ncbi:DUF5696 domain-containing protein [Sphingomonas sp. BGYR3]|uniref:DUF5696 domain-containing protein n=1 Tax=Sphingomonas sp. BGYR3 TaxID=2975483 RepID=UPI0021A8A568|nr:DUF5696 domain-containing protein [Sphingomonas sp. BGYR3]MDG5488542.1 DUF5696 domain-containing protein [Sphingomonas sp. BGYR3]
MSAAMLGINLQPPPIDAWILPAVVKSASARDLINDEASGTITARTQKGAVHYRWKPDIRAGRGAGILSVVASVDVAPIEIRYAPQWAGQRVSVISTDLRSVDNEIRLIQQVDVDGERVKLALVARIASGALNLEMTCDKPLVSALRINAPVAAALNRIALPYSPVPFYRISNNGLFISSYLDWSTSASTRYDGSGALYEPKTDGRRNLLHERLIVRVSGQLKDVLPKNSWSRSRYYDRVGGRLVIDVTETLPFANIEAGIDHLIAAGLSDCILIVHVWQKMGYDNGLPVVLPANAFLGGAEVLRSIGRKVKSVGCEFALHQNYIDQYPNSGEFDPTSIAVDSNRSMLKAWLNTSVGQQSYSLRPDMFVLMAQRYSPAIKQTLGTTAAFVDVNSSFLPWERVDMEASRPGAGRFSAFLAGSKAMFEALQSVEKGPVFGEGHQHFYWTGALDGVEAEMTVGYAGDIRDAPLWVDFDLLRIHPYQHNFGMGFYNRYAPATAASRDPMTEERTRDLYRTQQLAFAHLPYRSQTLWADPRLFVQEAALSVPVAKGYRRAAATEIRYPVDGQWQPIEAALPRAAGRAVRVRYDNGLVITANTGTAPVTDGKGRQVASAGWSAYGAGIEGWSTTMADGRSDFMRDAASIYADPRGVAGNWGRRGTGPAALVDFGVLRTNGQTWLRCAGGRWTILGFADRGTVDIEVERSAVAAPSSLRSERTAADARVEPGSVPGWWRARLLSGQRYTTSVACSAG